MSYDLIGALPAGSTPVWLRAVVTREGQDIVTRCCVVAEGQVMPIEVRVNVPRLAASLRAMGLAPPPGQDGVAGFGSWIKKAVKTVTKSKVVKAVQKTVSKVVRNPVFQIAAGPMTLGIHAVDRATGGRGIIKGPLGKLVDAGMLAASNVVMPGVAPAALLAAQKLGSAIRAGKSPLSALPAAASSALGFISPQASAALGVGLKTVQAARLGSTIASVAKVAQNQVNLGRAAGAAIKAGKVDPKKALPLVRNAVKIQTNVKALAPKLAKQVVASANVKKALARVAARSKAGSADAKQAAFVIAKSAQALDSIRALQARASDGIPGLLVTSTGRVVKAPRGRFELRSSTVARPDILYRGAKEPQLEGSFSPVSGAGVGANMLTDDGHTVRRYDDPSVYDSPTGARIGAGPSWGGSDDPGNDLEGPLLPARHPGKGWSIDVAGVMTP